MDQFEGKVAVITGGGSGFGREFAIKGASLGMKLVLADVDAERARRDRRDAARGGRRGDRRADRRLRRRSGRRARATTLDTFGAVHLLFNNAGVGAGGFVWESSARTTGNGCSAST